MDFLPFQFFFKEIISCYDSGILNGILILLQHVNMYKDRVKINRMFFEIPTHTRIKEDKKASLVSVEFH